MVDRPVRDGRHARLTLVRPRCACMTMQVLYSHAPMATIPPVPASHPSQPPVSGRRARERGARVARGDRDGPVVGVRPRSQRGVRPDGGAALRVGIVGATGYAARSSSGCSLAIPTSTSSGSPGATAQDEPIGGIHPHLAATGPQVDDATCPRPTPSFLALPARRGGRARARPRRGRDARSSTSGPTSGCAIPPTIRAGTTSSIPRRTCWRDRRLRPAGAASRGAARRSRTPTVAIVGAPGCYPTATLLALAPLARAGPHRRPRRRRQERRLGRRPRPEAGPDVRRGQREREGVRHRRPPARRRDRAGARRAPRSSAGASADANPGAVAVDFLPHLIPMTRGILSACHVRPTRPVTQAELDALYAAAYAGEPFVTVVDDAAGHEARPGSNFARVYVRLDERTGRIIAIGVDRQPRQGRRRPGRPGVQRRPSACPRRPVSSSCRWRPDRWPSRPLRSTALPRRRRVRAATRSRGLPRRRLDGRASRPPAGRTSASSSTTGGACRAAAVFTPNAFAAAPVAARAGISLATPASRRRRRSGWAARSSRRAAARTPRRAPPVRRPGAICARSSRAALGVRRDAGPRTSRPGSSGPGCRSTRSAAVASQHARPARARRDCRRSARGGRRGAAHDRLARPRSPPTELDLPGARRWTRAVRGDRHRQGRRHDPPADGDDAVGRDDGRERRRRTCSGALLRPAAARTWDQLRSTATRARMTRSSCSRRASRGRRRSLPAAGGNGARRGASRRSRATWRASRRPTARAPRC